MEWFWWVAGIYPGSTHYTGLSQKDMWFMMQQCMISLNVLTFPKDLQVYFGPYFGLGWKIKGLSKDKVKILKPLVEVFLKT